MVSYRDGTVKACGAEALRDFEEQQENVAYWFKVTAYPAEPLKFKLQNLTCD
jgi:hypothetical protein